MADLRPLHDAAHKFTKGKKAAAVRYDCEALYIVGKQMRDLLANGQTAEWYREMAPTVESKHYLRIADVLDAFDFLTLVEGDDGH